MPTSRYAVLFGEPQELSALVPSIDPEVDSTQMDETGTFRLLPVSHVLEKAYLSYGFQQLEVHFLCREAMQGALCRRQTHLLTVRQASREARECRQEDQEVPKGPGMPVPGGIRRTHGWSNC